MMSWKGKIFFGLYFLLSLSANTGETRGELARNVGDSCLYAKCGGVNMICNNSTKKCECNPTFPYVVISGVNSTLCYKPTKLQEECYTDKACVATDENSKCLQVDNKAICNCVQDYHLLLDRSSGLLKCVQEREHTNSDLATFIGVGVGMTLFCGLTCLVLRIFARARFGPRRHHYANAHLAPPTVITEHADGQEDLNSRHSSQRSSIGGGSRRPSMLAPPGPRPGDSRRASNSSIRSTSSARSYSLKNHHHQHRPSDPEMHLTPHKLPDHSSSANVSPNSRNHSRSPQRDSRSSSTGAIGLN